MQENAVADAVVPCVTGCAVAVQYSAVRCTVSSLVAVFLDALCSVQCSLARSLS